MANEITTETLTGELAELLAGLPTKQGLFVQEYIIDFNGTKAIERAGYKAKGAAIAATKLLMKPKIQAAIALAVEQRAERTGVQADMVVQELARLGFSNMADYVTWGPTGVTLKTSEELTENQARAVVEVSETVTENGRTVKFKLHDKKGALDSLAKHLGMFIERKEITGKDGKPLSVWDVLVAATDDDEDNKD